MLSVRQNVCFILFRARSLRQCFRANHTQAHLQIENPTRSRVPAKYYNIRSSFRFEVLSQAYCSMIAISRHAIDAREVRARLDTPNVRILLSRGYTLTEIQHVIEERLRNTGDDFPSIIDLAQAINQNREIQGSSTASAAQIPLNSANRNSYNNTNSANNSNTTDSFATDGSSSSASWQQPRLNGASNQRSPPSSRHREYAIRGALDEEVDAIDASVATDSFIPSTIRYTPRDVERLKAEQRQLIEANRCKLCLDQTIGSVILPCGHACTCVGCVTMVTHCPMCRMFIRGTVKINME